MEIIYNQIPVDENNTLSMQKYIANTSWNSSGGRLRNQLELYIDRM